MMRIITGTAKGTPLLTLAGDTTRPTSERAKEAIFSMIQFEVEGMRVLDLFSGSGQLALEALSRGARQATLCDASPDAINIIRQNAAKTKLQDKCDIRQTDAFSFLKLRAAAPYDLVFLDPPYAMGAIPKALSLLLSGGYLAPHTKLFCESASPDDVFGGDANLAAAFSVLKQNRYGIAHVTLLLPCREEGNV